MRAARWLAPRLPAAAVLAVNDIGAFKYLLPNRIVDLAGIANPGAPARGAAARGARASPGSGRWLAAVARRRPDYVAIFPAWLPAFAVDGRVRLLRLRVAGNNTMGGDEVGLRHALDALPADGGRPISEPAMTIASSTSPPPPRIAPEL